MTPTGDTKCIKCARILPRDAYSIRASNDTVRQPCRDCSKLAKAAYRKANLEKYRERNRQWRANNPGVATRNTQRAAALNPEQRKAHQLVWTATRNGTLLKQPCEVCGDPVAVAHHDDYSQPLVVRWLCRTHHGEHHARAVLSQEAPK